MRQIWAIIVAAWLWFVAAPKALFDRLFKRKFVWRFERVEDFPDILIEGRVYLAGEDDQFWGAAMTCPCGCGDRIELNMLPQARPRWAASLGYDGPATLNPSIWRKQGCKSHFFVRQGQVDWC